MDDLRARRILAARSRLERSQHYLSVFADAYELQRRGIDDLARAVEEARVSVRDAEEELAALLEAGE